MKKILFILATILVVVSCDEKKEKLTANQILDTAIENSGRRQLYASQLSFEFNGITYTSTRDAHNYVYEMKRVRDTITYLAKAFNGGFDYTENGVSKSYGAQNGQVEKQLLALNDFMLLPAIFENDNSIIINLKEEAVINSISYLSLIHI